MEPTFRAPRGPRDIIAELPPEHRDLINDSEALYQQKAALVGVDTMASLGTFGGSVGSGTPGSETVTIGSSSFAEGMRYVTIATSNRDTTPKENETLRRRLSHIASYAAARTAHHFISALSETSRLPIETVRENLDSVDWQSIAQRFIEGSSRPDLRTHHTAPTDELRALPVTDERIAAFSFQKSLEYSSEVIMLLSTALLSNHKKTAIAVRNTLYSQAEAVPRYTVTWNEQQQTEFVDENGQPLHITDFLYAKLRKSAYGQAVVLLDGIIASKDTFADMSAAQKRMLDIANREDVWQAFADHPSATPPETSDQAVGQFVVDHLLDTPLFPPAPSGESSGVSAEQIEREIAAIPSAYVDRSRFEMLDEIKGWTRGAKSVGAVFGGKGARRVRDATGEMVEDKYYGVMLPIYDADDNIIANYLVAESIIAGRNVTIVYRSDVGGLPWEQVAKLLKNEARHVKGVRFLTHTTVGERSVTETTQEKLLYLFTCSAEEYEQITFSGENAKGDLRVRGAGRIALEQTLEQPEN